MLPASANPTSSPPVSPGVWRWAWSVVALAVVLVPNLVAVVIPFEAFPWTSAPMFAHSPVNLDRFNLTFTMVDGAGIETPLPEEEASGLSPWHFRRNFLVAAWASDDDKTPFGAVADDTEQKRQARLQRYFKGLERFTAARGRRVFRGQRRIDVARIQRANDDRDDLDAVATGRRIDMGSWDFTTHHYRLPGATP